MSLRRLLAKEACSTACTHQSCSAMLEAWNFHRRCQYGSSHCIAAGMAPACGAGFMSNRGRQNLLRRCQYGSSVPAEMSPACGAGFMSNRGRQNVEASHLLRQLQYGSSSPAEMAPACGAGFMSNRGCQNVEASKLLRQCQYGSRIPVEMASACGAGFMSNRGRQNVASYLILDCGVDWRQGADYFESVLTDYDVCSNWGNWHAAAGLTVSLFPF